MSYRGRHSSRENKTSCQHNVIHFKNKKMFFLISSNHLSNFRIKFWHLLSNTKVDLKNGVAYKKNLYSIYLNSKIESTLNKIFLNSFDLLYVLQGPLFSNAACGRVDMLHQLLIVLTIFGNFRR